jgi:hypothetical protein
VFLSASSHCSGCPSCSSGLQSDDYDRHPASFCSATFALKPRNRRHLEGGEPVDAIDAVARAIGGDIVVMGAPSRSGLTRIFISNTAESLLDRLACDLLIVKPLRFAGRVPSARRGVRVISLISVVH